MQFAAWRSSSLCRGSAVTADTRLAAPSPGNSGNGVLADLDFSAPAGLVKRSRPCQRAVVRLSADRTDRITALCRTGHGIHMRFDNNLTQAPLIVHRRVHLLWGNVASLFCYCLAYRHAFRYRISLAPNQPAFSRPYRMSPDILGK